jgi:hypothetical protein
VTSPEFHFETCDRLSAAIYQTQGAGYSLLAAVAANFVTN